MDYRCFLREVHYRIVDENEDNCHPTSFTLKDASKLAKVDVGTPFFQHDNRHYTIEGLVPKKEDQIQLTRKEQSWLLVEIPIVPDYPEYAWAALRPARTVPVGKTCSREK